MSFSPEPDPEVDTTYLDFLALRAASLGDLLRTNSPPSEREANLRETELRDAHDVLEKLDQEIEQAQIALSSLVVSSKPWPLASTRYLPDHLRLEKQEGHQRDHP